MGVTNYKIQGYTTSSTTNYAYGEDIADTKSPYEMVVNYGSDTVSGDNLLPSEFLRIGQSIVILEASSVVSIKGWLSSNNGNVVTIAICKVTPVENSSTAIVPTVIDEIVLTGLNNNNKIVLINETTITAASLLAGDIVFPMIKEDVAGSGIYMNLSIQTTTY
jgi:hypothetical protein